MQTTPEFASSARAEILARLICKEPVDEDARRALEQVERVAQAGGTDSRRAIVWLWVTLAIPVALGFDRWLVEAADTIGDGIEQQQDTAAGGIDPTALPKRVRDSPMPARV